MQYHDFLAQVERRAELTTSSGEAKTAIQATLETFCDHLAGNAPAKLAAQLPEEIAEIITAYKNDPDAEGEGFGVEEFVRRVAEKIGLEDKEQARNQATAVLAVVQEAISPGEWEKLSGTFPAEYKTLFEAETSDILSARA
jgi:uncharacterized protein (DUF2267 family)